MFGRISSSYFKSTNQKYLKNIKYKPILNKALNRFNKIRLYHVNGYINILPIKYLIKNPYKYHQIQLNTDTHFNAIMMDIDDEDLLTEWNSIGLPTPTLQTLNKDNNKAHLVWLLNIPVSKRNKKAVQFYKDIVNSIKLLIGADRAYQNHQTKNFLNEERFRVTYNDVAYDLADFQGFIIKDESDFATKQERLNDLEDTGSRHIDLFNQLRKYGYPIAQKKNLYEKLVKRAELINSQYRDPIKPKAIIKSVYNFCDENKNNFKDATKIKYGVMKFKKIQNLSKEKYKKEVTTRQRKSAKRTTTLRRCKTSSRIKVAIDAIIRRKIKLSYANLALEVKCSLRTAKRYAKIIKLFVQKTNGVIRSIRVIAFRMDEVHTNPIKGYFSYRSALNCSVSKYPENTS